MFHLYWSQQMLAANAQMMSQACSFWAEGWSRMAEGLNQETAQEYWLGPVDRPRANWTPAVSNCAAGAYSAWGMDLSRSIAANEGRYQAGRQKA